jgi:hypothetical protein
MIAAYESAMSRALAMPSATPAQRAARSAAVAQARSRLAAAANKPLSAAAMQQVDRLLGLPPGVAPNINGG